jgi:hypothetical protein
MRRRFRRVVLAITGVAVVAIAGGVTYAVADIGGGVVINGCYKSQNGQLRLIDPATDESAVSPLREGSVLTYSGGSDDGSIARSRCGLRGTARCTGQRRD